MRSLRWRSAWQRRPDTSPVGGVVPLGSGAAADLGIGAKAALLDRAAAAGLPVPTGFTLIDGAAADEARPAADRLGPGRLAVRSAFSVEDGTEKSFAGHFHTVLRVDPLDVGAAVEQVRASAETYRRPLRRDVLVMTMIDARTSGVAFSEPGRYDDLVNVVDGTAEHLVGGEIEGERILLPRLERAERGWSRRLQRLLRKVRREFGDEPWDVEWADDGRTCWLIQVRPVTSPSLRNEALTIANHAEILPPLPSPLMTNVIAEAGPDLFGWYRRFDPTLPSDRDFLVVVAGRPFINLSLLEDMLRHLGLPTGLVADSIGGPPENAHPVNPARLVRAAPVLARMGGAQVAAVASARRIERTAASFGTELSGGVEAALAELRRAYTHLVTGMFPLSSAIGPPLAVLRRTGTLVEHAGRHRTVTSQLAETVDEARHDPATAATLLDRYGHRGVYESDIARPRFRDDPSLLGTRPAVGSAPPAASPPPRTVQGTLTTPIWWFARPPLSARERLRDAAMVGFATIRDRLVELADAAVARGQLPTVDHLWLLDAEEARQLDRGWVPEPGFWTERCDELERLALLDPPAVVHRFDDPATWSHGPVPEGSRLQGLPLTDGVVQGRAWVLREPSLEPPPGFRPESTVLVARSVDAGWIPTFTLAAAVVVETGGDLSHGSILLRERGVPAITNVRGATRAISTGDEVEVRAGAGVIERIPTTAPQEHPERHESGSAVGSPR